MNANIQALEIVVLLSAIAGPELDRRIVKHELGESSNEEILNDLKAAVELASGLALTAEAALAELNEAGK